MRQERRIFKRKAQEVENSGALHKGEKRKGKESDT